MDVNTEQIIDEILSNHAKEVRGYIEEINHQEQVISHLRKVNEQFRQANEKITDRTRLCLKPEITSTEILIFHEKTLPFFDSTLAQWESLFSKEIELKKPIKLKDLNLKGLAALLDFLYGNKLIKNAHYSKVIERSKAFEYNGLIVDARKLKGARSDSKMNGFNNGLVLGVIEDLRKTIG